MKKGPDKTEAAVPESKKYIVYDPSLCTGCHTCELVCSTYKEGGKYQPSLSRIQVIDDPFGGSINSVEPKVCWQCQDPKCMVACTFGAISIDGKTGARYIDEKKCQGKCYDTQPCIEACGQDFDPPRIVFDPKERVALMCDLCGGNPQCVEWCSNGTLKYVSASELKKVGSYEQDFNEPYTKDFGPPHTLFKGSTQTFEKVYPDKEK